VEVGDHLGAGGLHHPLRRALEEVGRHDYETVAALAGRPFSALSQMLGSRPYLFGEAPTGTDASAFGALTAALAPHFTSPVLAAGEAFPNLVAYRDRMMERYFLEFAAPAGQAAMDSAASTRLIQA
jgi:glutathione S-transferase